MSNTRPPTYPHLGGEGGGAVLITMCARSVIRLDPRLPTDDGRWGGIAHSFDRLCDRWPASELFLTI